MIFPHDVEGWLTEEEGRALAEFVRGKTVLEIGAYCGRSTICMAQTAKFVESLDTWDGRGTPNPKRTLIEWGRNLDRYDIKNAKPQTSRSSCKMADRVFIDAAHDLKSVREDILFACSKLTPNGLIAFHDYNRRGSNPGVFVAVNEFIRAGAKLLKTVGTIALVEPVRTSDNHSRGTIG